MTSARRHSRAPLRRSSAPERILSAGLATATCVGIVGLVGARTIQANAESAGQDQSATAEQAAPVAYVESTTLAGDPEPTTSAGLTQADLDAYAAQLAAEKDRLDAYRAKLVKTAKRLQRQVARQSAAASAATTWIPSASTGGKQSGSSAKTSGRAVAPKPAKAAPQKSAPAPKPASAPAAKAAPKPQAPAPQSNTKTS